MAVTFTIETEQESDGRWIAEVMELPGVMVYGSTTNEAVAQAQVQESWQNDWSNRMEAKSCHRLQS